MLDSDYPMEHLAKLNRATLSYIEVTSIISLAKVYFKINLSSLNVCGSSSYTKYMKYKTKELVQRCLQK